MRDLAHFGLCSALICCGCAAPQSPTADQAVRPEVRQPIPPSAQMTSATAVSRQPIPPVAGPAAGVAAQLTGSGPIPAERLHSPSEEQAAALDATIAELRALGAIDPAAEEQLRADLRQTDPALWPRLLQYFRASPARRTNEQTNAAGPAAKSSADAAPSPQTTDVAHADTRPAETKKPTAASASANIGGPAAKPQEQPPPQADTAAAIAPVRSTGPEPSSTGSEVHQASFEAAQASRSWQQHLQAAIRDLESESSAPPKTTAEIAQHADLRLLYLAAGQRDDALRPISGIPPVQQDFWSKEIYGLATYLDGQRITDGAQRAAAAKEHLTEAISRLAELGTLVVRNLAFCTKVSSYGVFTRFESDVFSPGQEVLLYAEVENFKSASTEQGYHTVLHSSYQILDSRGQRVDQRDFSTTEEHCLNPRRDFFIRYFLHMPQRIYDGKYTLQLTIEDTLSQKIGQSSIEFTVKGARE